MKRYSDITEKYKLKKDVTEQTLLKNGFNKSGIFKCFVYKDIVQFIIRIDIEENWWGYQVYDIDTNTFYAPYYDRDCGKHLEVEEMDKRIALVLDLMVKNNILINKRSKDTYGKKNR